MFFDRVVLFDRVDRVALLDMVVHFDRVVHFCTYVQWNLQTIKDPPKRGPIPLYKGRPKFSFSYSANTFLTSEMFEVPLYLSMEPPNNKCPWGQAVWPLLRGWFVERLVSLQRSKY